MVRPFPKTVRMFLLLSLLKLDGAAKRERLFSLIFLSYHLEGLDKGWLGVKREDFEREKHIHPINLERSKWGFWRDLKENKKGEGSQGYSSIFTLELPSN
jgi:hypothetical protein